jgi:uncharacterized protein (DUF849 family)
MDLLGSEIKVALILILLGLALRVGFENGVYSCSGS